MKIRAILNEFLASAAEINCSNHAAEWKEIACRACSGGESLMLWPVLPQMPV
jgi:hypothetical protein